MNKNELNQLIENIKVNDNLVKKIEDKYGSVSLDVMKILSYKEKKEYIGDWRIVSNAELFDSINELHVDFVSENIIPVFDAMDNDYICYDLKDNKWTYYNIVDDIKFGAEKDVADYLEE